MRLALEKVSRGETAMIMNQIAKASVQECGASNCAESALSQTVRETRNTQAPSGLPALLPRSMLKRLFTGRCRKRKTSLVQRSA